MKITILAVLLSLILIVGVASGIVFVYDGFTPVVSRLCVVGAILGVVGWVAADTLE